MTYNEEASSEQILKFTFPALPQDDHTVSVLRELAGHFRRERNDICQDWIRRMRDAHLLSTMSADDLSADMHHLYDLCINALEGGTTEAADSFAGSFAERMTPLDLETYEAVSVVLLLHDVLSRSLFRWIRQASQDIKETGDISLSALAMVSVPAVARLIQRREHVIWEQQEAIRELSTPVLQVRERLLILPIIGVMESQRSRQLTEQLLRAIRSHRAKVVVIDITGVAVMDSAVANHLVQTVEASKLLGAKVIVSGLSPEIAQTLVHIGVDLGKMNTVGDLQGAIEEAERLLGYKVVALKQDSAESDTQTQ